MARGKRFPHKMTVRLDKKSKEKIKMLSEFLEVSMAQIVRNAVENAPGLGIQEEEYFLQEDLREVLKRRREELIQSREM